MNPTLNQIIDAPLNYLSANSNPTGRFLNNAQDALISRDNPVGNFLNNTSDKMDNVMNTPLPSMPSLPQGNPLEIMYTVLGQLINHPQIGQQIRAMITQYMQPFQNAAMAMQPNRYVQMQNGGYQPYTNLPSGRISVNGQQMIPPVNPLFPGYTAVGANQTGHAIPFSRMEGGSRVGYGKGQINPQLLNQGRSNANTRKQTSTKTR